MDSLLTNDPAGLCDPLGFPYMYTWELRTIDITQTPKHVVLLSFFYGNYRVIWTDGRQPPTDADPRYNGYSVGKWMDDYTFVVTTTGMLRDCPATVNFKSPVPSPVGRTRPVGATLTTFRGASTFATRVTSIFSPPSSTPVRSTCA